MVSSSQSSATNSNDRYRSTSVPAQDIQRSHNLTGKREEVSNFDLLLNLPIFDSHIPNPDALAKPNVTEPEKAQEPVDPTEEKDDLEPVDSYAPVVALPYFEEIKPVAKTESIHDEGSSSDRRKPKVDLTSDRENNSESDRDTVKPIAVASPAKESKNAPEPVVKPNGIQSTLDETPIADQTFDEPSDLNDPQSKPLLTKSDSQKIQTVEAEQTQHESERSKADPTDAKSNMFVAKTSEQAKDSLTESLPDQSPLDEAEPDHSEHDSIQLNRRAERLENNRRDDKEPSNSNSSEATSADSSLSNEFNANVDPLEIGVSSAEATSESSNVQLAGAVDAQSTIVTAIAFETIQPSPVAITATASLSGARDANAPTTSGPSHSVVGSLNASSGANGSQANTNSSTGTSGSTATGRSTLTPYQEQKVLQRVLRGMEQLANGSNQVRLRLHPPELGSLQVTIRIEGQQVAGLIEVEHTAARDALQNNLPQLQARLSDQGLNVQQFEIRVVDPNQFSQGGQLGGTWHNGGQQNTDARDERRANGYLDRLRNRIDSKESEPSRLHPQLWTRTHGHIDVRV